MRATSVADIHRHAVGNLRLDSDALDLTCLEAVAATIRRAASFFCPCPPKTLLNVVLETHRGIVGEAEAFAATVEATLENLVAYGDLLELEEPNLDNPETQGRRLLYCAPPCYVPRRAGSFLLLGIAADGLSPLSKDLQTSVEHIGYSRILTFNDSGTAERLRELGFNELTIDAWMKSPAPESQDQLLSRANRQLETAKKIGEVSGLRLIDPNSTVAFYRRRWVEPKDETGQFVGRRPQAYGADIWCYVDMENGQPVRLVDLPLLRSKWRDCDDAWYLQTAIDAKLGNPQQFLVRDGPLGSKIVDFFSPLPMWARRRFDAVGEAIPPSGSLFSYKFKDKETPEEVEFLLKRLWLAPAEGSAF